jgi:hypothetical protein
VRSDFQEKWRRFEPRELARILPEIRDEMARHGYEVPAEVAKASIELHRELTASKQGYAANSGQDRAAMANRGNA